MNQRIESRIKTRNHRKTLSCKVYEVKIDFSKLNSDSKQKLKNLFAQSKYFYNYCLSQTDVFHINTKIKEVPVKVIDQFEDRKITAVSAQMKQSVHQRLIQNIVNLSKAKNKGRKIGKLKYISHLDSIPLKQYGTTYKIEKERNRVKLQGFKQKILVFGLEQIPENAEISCGNLIHKPSGYYIHITTFQNITKVEPPEKPVGIDFGCETQLTLSNRIKIEFQIPVSKKLKRLDRKIMKKNRKKSNNKWKDQQKRKKEYEKLNNRKTDIRNKIVNILTKNYKYVIVQDESISAWKAGNHGKKIQNSGIGGIIRDLKNKSHTSIVVNKFFASTQICPVCDNKQKLPQEVRIYECPVCGYVEDRDVKSSFCIEKEGLRMIGKSEIFDENKIRKPPQSESALPMERREIKLEETETSTGYVLNLLQQIKYVKASLCL